MLSHHGHIAPVFWPLCASVYVGDGEQEACAVCVHARASAAEISMVRGIQRRWLY